MRHRGIAAFGGAVFARPIRRHKRAPARSLRRACARAVLALKCAIRELRPFRRGSLCADYPPAQARAGPFAQAGMCPRGAYPEVCYQGASPLSVGQPLRGLSAGTSAPRPVRSGGGHAPRGACPEGRVFCDARTFEKVPPAADGFLSLSRRRRKARSLETPAREPSACDGDLQRRGGEASLRRARRLFRAGFPRRIFAKRAGGDSVLRRRVCQMQDQSLTMTATSTRSVVPTFSTAWP